MTTLLTMAEVAQELRMTRSTDDMSDRTTPLQDLEAICAEIYGRWDKDMRSGKLLAALAGTMPGYREDVDRVRAALGAKPRRKLCDGCGKNYADPPSALCPGCQAYQDHQR